MLLVVIEYDGYEHFEIKFACWSGWLMILLGNGGAEVSVGKRRSGGSGDGLIIRQSHDRGLCNRCPNEIEVVRREMFM
jgi:hypothetical protein